MCNPEWIELEKLAVILECKEETLRRNCVAKKYICRFEQSGKFKKYEIDLNSLPEKDLLKYQKKLSKINNSDVCSSSEYYTNAPEWSKKQADKYLELLSLTKVMKRNALETFVKNWNKDFPENTTSVQSIYKARVKYEEYKAYKKAGADRYLLRIETTDKELYKQMHPNMSFENRKKCLYDLKELGYEVGSGCLVGLPNQTIESLSNDILFFKELEADMIGIGPFIPHPDTPLKGSRTGSFELALKVMAIIRTIMKDINIPATTAMETLNPQGRIIALQSGANVVMPNVTTKEYRKKYEIYPNKICINENPAQCFGCISGKIKSIGRTVSTGYGSHKKDDI